MSLKIIKETSVERLAAKLVAGLKAERAAKGPFEFLDVAVANPNLGNWLKMKVLAKVPELSAGVEMPFLDQVLAERVKACYDGELELISGRDYPPIILDALMNHWRKEFVPLRKYVKEEYDPKTADGVADVNAPLKIKSQREARKAIQLAERLAELIDGYEATGKLGLLRTNQDKNDVYRAEQAVVDVLFGTENNAGRLAEKGRISLRQMFEAVGGKKDPAGAKLLMFGQTSLTDLQLKILKWVSASTEIVWYYPDTVKATAALQIWQTAKSKLWDAVKGVFGDSVECASVQKNGEDKTCLNRLQLALAGTESVERREQDASIQVIGAPGIRREVEMVYNAILGAVWEKNVDGKPVAKKDMSFSDIAVLVADMPTYRPMIEAVFDGRGQIPYGLVDTTTQDYSSYLDGFLALMNIARYGLSRKRVFDVLENPCVQRAMGFSRDDLLKWLGLAQKYGAYDGYKAEDSDERNASGHFNWEWALRRMRLGLVAQELKVERNANEDLPLEADDAETVCRFSEVVETLWRKLDALNHITESVECSSDDQKLWEKSWAGRLHAVMDEFLAVEKDDSIETLVRARIVRTLNSLKVIAGPQSYKLPVAVVEHVVKGTECAKGGYLRHGVTIGSLRSLAHVPFKQIFIVGLGEGGLPGRNDRSTLDVRNEVRPESRCDVLRPEENRSRMHAAVMSARERLVLSYPNRELGSDAKLYPSSVVNDLKDACTACVINGTFKEFDGYPLVESAESITTPVGAIKSAISGETVEPCFAGLLPSYSERAYVLAGRKQFVRREVSASNTSQNENKLGEPTPKDLAEFVKDPFTAILKRRLGIATEGYRDHCVDDASPLGVQSGPSLWSLQREMVTRSFETAFADSQNAAETPTDFLGDFAREKLAKFNKWAVGLGLTDSELKSLASGTVIDGAAVVCKKFSDTGGRPRTEIKIPPSACLEPLFAQLKKTMEDAGEHDLELCVKVVNVDDEKVGVWKWTISAAEARSYYEHVVTEYKEYLGLDNGGKYPVLTYDEVRELMVSVPDTFAEDFWERIAKALGAKEEQEWKPEKSFDNGVVIDGVAKAFTKNPGSEDLKRTFENLFRIPMTGKKVVEGGAE